MGKTIDPWHAKRAIDVIKLHRIVNVRFVFTRTNFGTLGVASTQVIYGTLNAIKTSASGDAQRANGGASA